MKFDDGDLLVELVCLDEDAMNKLDFGVVRMDRKGMVTFYNEYESRLSGLSKEKTIGRHFFEQVAPCSNNYLVSQRFWDEPELDAIVPYIFTFKMKPTPVRLRLLRSRASEAIYLLVERT
jgi:photoactive yellow protein